MEVKTNPLSPCIDINVISGFNKAWLHLLSLNWYWIFRQKAESGRIEDWRKFHERLELSAVEQLLSWESLGPIPLIISLRVAAGSQIARNYDHQFRVDQNQIRQDFAVPISMDFIDNLYVYVNVKFALNYSIFYTFLPHPKDHHFCCLYNKIIHESFILPTINCRKSSLITTDPSIDTRNAAVRIWM